VTDLQQFKVHQSSSIRETLAAMDWNMRGVVFVMDDADRVIGVATDGDVHRSLIANHNADASVTVAMTRNFVQVPAGTSREHILKLLDHRIKAVPVLDENQRLVDVATRDFFPLKPQRRIVARSRSPVRISFGGGGTDLTNFFYEHGGAVMNASISMYSHAVLRKRDDGSIRIESNDLKVTAEAGSLAEFLEQDRKMPLISSLLRLIRPDYGFELQVGSDFPIGSGLGGSAVVLSAIIGCFNQFREDRWDKHEISEMAFQAERLHMNIAGGWQDQYATVFGGFNFMEFQRDQNIIHPLRIQGDLLSELEESLLLCYTGKAHPTGIHTDQKKEMQKSEILDAVIKNKEITYRLKKNLLRGQLIEFGKTLDEAWQMKKSFSTMITSPEIDAIYDLARANGALGGKILGAGGGGFFLFYAHPMKRFVLEHALHERGLKTHRFTFDANGLQTWTLREEEVLGV
jgi:D-glycero-alpha-D-manno-heptose-7-phosphate kinase